MPCFWSDLYDTKLQALGWPSANLHATPFRAGKAGGRLVVLYGDGGTFTGIVGLGLPRLVMSARALLSNPHTLQEATDKLELSNPA